MTEAQPPVEHRDVILLIGVGLVGASIALALTRAGHRVHLRDRLTSHVRVAASLGAGIPDEPVPADVGLVIVAVPPDHCPAVITDALLEFPAATVTDVASVKGTLAHQVAALAGSEAYGRYVGSHPMAGSHRSGPVTADPDLFVDRTWVVTPHPRNPEARVAQVRDLARTCGAVVVTLDPDEHDTAVAAVSHLPHLASVLVAGQLTSVPDEHLRLAGQGLRDVTRIAAGDPDLWVQILSANTDSVRPQLTALRDRIDGLLAALGDRGDLGSVLRAGVAGTARIPGKHGRSAEAWTEVVVEIPDTPGALAKLFADVERAGVNVEDVAIEHDQVREVGFLALSVDPQRAAALAAELEAAAWTLRAGTGTDRGRSRR